MDKRIKIGFLKVTVFYFAIGMIMLVGIRMYPDLMKLLPVGATDRLFPSMRTLELGSGLSGMRFESDDPFKQGVFLLGCFLSALLLALPVGTTYLAIRTDKKRSIALVKLIVILPVAVTGLVLIVQNSLALAFSLAGIVSGAGIRFRANMREYTDAVFFLTSIGIGLSAGIGALGISFMMSFVFCYTILTVYGLDYGSLPDSEEGESEPVETTEETQEQES
jgi:hypothetical protein